MNGRDGNERSQTRLLTKTFFARLFESDLMPPGLPQVRLVVSVIAGIAIPLTLIPALIRLHASRLVAFQYTVSMIAVAFIALVIWEGIFPDARDGRILSTLPIRTRTFVVARLAALTALFGVFAAGSAALPSFVFVLAGNPVAHLIGLVALDAFAFFSIVALQCIVLNVAGRATAQRLAIVLQVAVVIVMLQLPLVPADPRRPPDLSAAATTWLPSLWFVGVYEVLAGHATPRALSLAALGAGAAIGLPLATALLYAATYRRLLRRAIEGEPAVAPRSIVALAREAAKRLLVVAVRDPVARAICLFTLQTIARSRRNKMLLAMYVGVGVALVLSVVLPTALHSGLAGFARPQALLLSLPLVMMFMTLVGIRSVIRIPVEIRANWIFRLAEPARRATAIGGVASAMIMAAVLPIVALAFASALMLWGPAVAIRHATYCAALGLLLTHALLLRLNKVPFTCVYYPGSSRLRVMWPFYLTLFTTYSFTMGRLEVTLLERDPQFLGALSIIFAVTAILVIARRVLLHAPTGLRFEERDSEALFEGFRLSEMLAAERAHRRATQEH